MELAAPQLGDLGSLGSAERPAKVPLLHFLRTFRTGTLTALFRTCLQLGDPASQTGAGTGYKGYKHPAREWTAVADLPPNPRARTA